MSLDYRYPGAQPFSAADRHKFFGRDRDSLRLSQQIRLEQMVVLYGKSGLGKSSLLNAAVLPRLAEDEADTGQHYLPISVRFGAYTDTQKHLSPLDSVLERLEPLTEKEHWSKRFGTAAPLWQKLKAVQAQHPVQPVLLVLDQFEELFTYPQAVVHGFAERLAEALYERIPQLCRKSWEEGTVKLNETEKEAFFKPLPLKVLFAIRSDRMSYLDSLKTELPDILHHTYELLPLKRSQAEDAIVNPAYLKEQEYIVPPFDYDNEALDKILDFLSTNGKAEIESTQLQIICQHAERLVETQQISHKTAAGIAQIIAEDLGDLATVYRTYYDAMLGEIASDEERLKVRRLIEDDLIFEPDKRRISLYEGIIQSKGISEETLRLLINKHHILRAEPNMSGGYTYELSHDTLVEPILQAKKLRVQQEYQAAEALRRQAAESERAEAEKRAAEAERKAAEQAALRAEAERGQKRSRIFSGLALLVSLVAIGAGYLAYDSGQKAATSLSQANCSLITAKDQEIQQNDLRIERYRRDKTAYENAQEEKMVRQVDIEIGKLKELSERLVCEKERIEDQLAAVDFKCESLANKSGEDCE